MSTASIRLPLSVTLLLLKYRPSKSKCPILNLKLTHPRNKFLFPSEIEFLSFGSGVWLDSLRASLSALQRWDAACKQHYRILTTIPLIRIRTLRFRGLSRRLVSMNIQRDGVYTARIKEQN